MSDLLSGTILLAMLIAALKMATPLLISAMGELVAQRAGIWNMAVEGTMLMAAYIAYVVVVLTQSPGLALAAAVAAALLTGALNGVLCVLFRLDQFVTGLALNMLASGVTLFWFRAGLQGKGVPTFRSLPALTEGPFAGLYWMTFLAFLTVPLVWWFLERTRPGLELRCLGENPEALDLRGVNVQRGQIGALLFASAMTGLAGGFLMLAFSDRFVPDFTGGRGWLVVVALIAGNWRPGRVLVAVLFFAALEALAIQSRVSASFLPEQLLLAAPYLVSLALMAVFRSTSLEPAALGIAYRRR